MAVCAEMYARSIPNSYRYKKEWMDAHCDSVNLLIMGNSHMLSIDPSLFKNAFNLANSSQNLEYDCWLLKEYVGKCPNLSVVLLPVDYHNMFSVDYEIKDASSWNRSIYYNLYMGYPKHGYLSMYHYELACSRFMISKILKYTYSVIIGSPYDIKCDKLGRRVPKTEKNVEQVSHRIFKSDLKKHSYSKLISEIRSNSKYLEEIINICRSRDIRLIMISTPYWHTYNDYLDSIRLGLLDSCVFDLHNRYNVEYYNYRDDVRFIMNSSLFSDGQHLSRKGSDIFTVFLRDKMKIK